MHLDIKIHFINFVCRILRFDFFLFVRKKECQFGFVRIENQDNLLSNLSYTVNEMNVFAI